MSIHKLSKPVTFEDVEYTELNLDFENLTGGDIASIETQYNAEGNDQTVFVKENSKTFLAYVVARAAKVPVQLIFALKAYDFVRVTNKARNFLLITG
ncbi:phage tail assembly protein [Paenibacillus camelliae]|uniref:phage tail assembly protein n=1 Tax=Paenibacillus camelliae TaxID=512410 RepID=UPI002040A63C|nr:phage tail assembly protein [Paenibacillus camelliae]MCM3632932.1 phage tail assembly protein [Paenibacillus camelliae]